MWGGKHRVVAVKERMLGDYPRANKCRSMSIFPETSLVEKRGRAKNLVC
jgi:hypothetical protein